MKLPNWFPTIITRRKLRHLKQLQYEYAKLIASVHIVDYEQSQVDEINNGLNHFTLPTEKQRDSFVDFMNILNRHKQ